MILFLQSQTFKTRETFTTPRETCRRVILGSLLLLSTGTIQALAEDAPVPTEPSVEASTNTSTTNTTSVSEIVVSASRSKTPTDQLGSSISVVTEKEIELKGGAQVIDVIEDVPGIDVVRSGPRGGLTSVFMRGANPEHTLIMIDGIELNNPIETSRTFDLSNVSVDNIEQIEILRGPQGTLYGSNALGGVINIITKKGEGTPVSKAGVEIGSYDTTIERVSSSGSIEGFGYSLGLSRLDTGGISSVDNATTSSERDGYENTSGSARLDYALTDAVDVALISRMHISHADIDNGPGPVGDDPNRIFNNRQYFVRGEATVRPIQDLLESTASVSYAHTTFTDDNDPDEAHPIDILRSKYRGSQLEFDLQNTIAATDTVQLIAGFESKEERGSSDYFSDGDFGVFQTEFLGRSATTNAGYFQTQLALKPDFFTTIGYRIDNHSQFGSEGTWRVAPTYQVAGTGLRLLASVGTGFKAPSLYQLYSEFGREDLQEEESLGWDLGFEQQLFSETTTVAATFFHNDFDNLISFDPNSFLFENIAEARTQGVEFIAKYEPSKLWSTKISYTYTDSEDQLTGSQLLRRAAQQAAAMFRYNPTEELTLSIRGHYVGSRFDNDFNSFPVERVKLPEYTTIDLRAGYTICPMWSVYAHADNIFDNDYQQVLGYNTTGAAVYGGIQATY